MVTRKVKERISKVETQRKEKIPNKDEMISMRLTTRQLQILDEYRTTLEEEMGLPVTRGWVVTRLIELGTPAFEKLYGVKLKAVRDSKKE